MTEAEAKTKWCPVGKVRTIRIEGGATMTEGSSNCIGSACMMWRWDEKRPRAKDGALAKTPKLGHCGLAGKP